jgi:PDZ domain-containing protein
MKLRGLLSLMACVTVLGAAAYAAEPEVKPAGKYGYLGVGLDPVPEVLATQLGLERGEGMLVTQVAKGSPAQKAGFETNDVIVKVGDQIVLAEEQLRKLIGYTKPGEVLNVQIMRKAKRQTLTTTLGATEQAPAVEQAASTTHTVPGLGHVPGLRRFFTTRPPDGVANIRMIGPDGKPLVITMKGGEDLLKQLEEMKKKGLIDAKTVARVKTMMAQVTAAPDAPDVVKPKAGTIDAKLQKRLSFDFVATPMNDVFAFIRSLTKINVLIDPDLAKRNHKITLKVEQMATKNALDWICKVAGCEYAASNDVLAVGGAAFVKRFKAIKPLATDDAKIGPVLAKPLSFDFIATPLTDVSAFFRNLLKINIIVLPAPGPNDVTFKLEKVPAGLVFQYVALLTGRPVAVEKQAVVFKAPPKR